MQRTSIRLACDREARFGVIGSCLACSALTVLGDFNPQFPDRAIGATFECADLTFAFGGNRLLFVRKIRNCPLPDYYLLALASERCGAFDCRNSGWKSEIGGSHCRESAPRQSGGTFTDAARRLGEDIIGYLATQSGRHATPCGAHPDGKMRFEKFVMRYAKNSLVINPERDIPLLLQVRNSRFISHQQLFEFMQYQGIDHSRSGFNWRTRRLLGSGYLSVCECRSGAGSPVYRITKEGLALLEHGGHFTTVLHSRTEHLPHVSQIFHALELNGIQLRLRRQNLLAGWHSDVEVASFNNISRSPYQKDYDAVVDVWLGDKRVCFALEYERSLKSARQYERIRQALESEQQVGCILYLTAGIEILVHLVHEFQPVSTNLAFANAPDFAELLLDTTVITHRNLSGVKFREVLR